MSETDGFKVDLTNCEREPIHVLGNIQPFGFLIAVEADWVVCRASANVGDFIGISAEDLLGRGLSEILTEKSLHAMRNRITLLRGPDAVERLFNQVLVTGGKPVDMALHFSGRQIVIEAEPAAEEELEASAMVRAMIARLSQSEGMAAYLREGARQVRGLTGFTTG